MTVVTLITLMYWIYFNVSEDIKFAWSSSKTSNNSRISISTGDNVILGAVYDITVGAPSAEIFLIYPELSWKWDVIISYLNDAQNLDINDESLYKLYPELSNNVKMRIRSWFKEQIKELGDKFSIQTRPVPEEKWLDWGFIISRIMIIYFFFLCLQFIYFKWIIYIIYGNKR